MPSPVRVLRELLAEVLHPGESRLPGPELWHVGRRVLAAVIVTTNLIGACAVVGIALFVVPIPVIPHSSHVRLLNVVLAAAYALAAVVAGVLLGTLRLHREGAWLREERPATLAQIRGVLQTPLRLFGLQVSLWLIAALLFGIVDAHYSGRLGLRVGCVVAATGVTTAALSYVLTELCLRPVAARALEHGVPERLVSPGVATRAVLAWVLGTGLQLLGIVVVGVMALTGDRALTAPGTHPLRQLGISMVVLGGTGLVVGLQAMILVARTTADPIDSVRRGLERVRRGELDARVPVYDGTQIGRLQLGFNEMVAGLRERERIRQAFGTYVDPDVAERILEQGTAVEGEEVEVTCMFIDIRNFTGFAERTEAAAVLAAINELFGQFVEVIHDHGGRVDKFIGDGLMAVFGAPRRMDDHADRALAAALEIARSAHSEAGLRFGIGLNSGRVVAGNVGGSGRLEFSVIGDPVNVASRVEAATRTTGDTLLLAERTLALLRAPHPELVERPGVALKGKREDVRLFAPADGL